MVKHFSNFSSVEFEVRVGERDETDPCHEKQQVRIVALSLRLKRIITELVAVRLIMHVVFVFESMAVRVGCEDVVVTRLKK